MPTNLQDYRIVPPGVVVLGVDDATGKTLREALAFTKRAQIISYRDFVTGGDQVIGGAGVIFNCPGTLNEQQLSYVTWLRKEMGQNAPFTFVVPVAPSEELKAFAKANRVTRIVEFANPDALDFLAEALYLIATHKFRNVETGEIV